MKNIIMILLTLGMLMLSGCSDDELIEISSSENMANSLSGDELKVSSIERDTDVTSNNYKEAENNDGFRPLIVYVCGAVKNPGVYKLSEGSRAIDAITAAGGYTENASKDYLNLASLVNDGDKIYVPTQSEVEESQIIPEASNSNGLVNINTATKEELMTLPGIGESKAEKIISYRETNGKFSKPEDIMNITGIKEGMYNKIKDKICVR